MDKYNRLKKLGEGASGKVYLIENKENGELSVAKQINAVINEKDRGNAMQEAQLLKSMSHPNIVKLQDIFMTTTGKVLIIMDYADSGDLSQHVVERLASGRGLLPEIQCLEWLVQAGSALWYLHDRKVLHRDIKTRNLFLYSSGLLKVGDFGISCVLETTMAMAHTVVGTLYYLSPELVERTPYSFKSDVWALGIVLYELAALKQPFASNSLHELLGLIIKGEYEPLDTSYSDDLKSLVRSMLSRDPAVRPAVAEMLRMKFVQNAFANVNGRYGLGLHVPAECAKAVEMAPHNSGWISFPSGNNFGGMPPQFETADDSERGKHFPADETPTIALGPSDNARLAPPSKPEGPLDVAGGVLPLEPGGDNLYRSQQRDQLPHPPSTQPMNAKYLMYHPPPSGRAPCAPPPGPPPGAAVHVVTPRFAAAANALPVLKPQLQGGPSTVLRGAGRQVLMTPSS